MSVQEIIVRAVVTESEEQYWRGPTVVSVSAVEMQSHLTMSNLPAAGLGLQCGDEIEVVVRKINESRRLTTPT